VEERVLAHQRSALDVGLARVRREDDAVLVDEGVLHPRRLAFFDQPCQRGARRLGRRRSAGLGGAPAAEQGEQRRSDDELETG